MHGVECDLNSTDPHAPTQYNYDYEVHGVPDTRFPEIADSISQHFTAKKEWKVDDKHRRLTGTCDPTKTTCLSLVISPKGNLLPITLSTPCAPKVETTFTP